MRSDENQAPFAGAQSRARGARRATLAVTITALAALLAACGSSKSPTTSSSEPTSSTASTSSTPSTSSTTTSATPTVLAVSNLPKLGHVLVDSQGHTLYIFEPDAHSKVTCTGGCAQLWPPLKLKEGAKASGAVQVRSSLLGSDPDPEGGRVVTYDGWPLYTYQADTGAGQATGQGIETNGGLWYVISPTGTVITTK